MSGFKLSNLTPKRAAQIRRGVVSGKILLRAIISAPLAPLTTPVWLALKLRTYMAETESYLEQEALMRTVVHGIREVFTPEQIKRFAAVYGALCRS